MSPSNDRREFFRIDDQVSFKLAPIVEGQDSPADSAFESMSAELATLNELRRLESHHATLFLTLSEKFPTIAQYLKAQNEKIDTLARYLVTKFGDEFNLQPVNISAKGLRFFSDQDLAVNSHWHIALLLFPEYFSLQCECKVVANQQENNFYRISLEFIDISEGSQDELVKHITQLQSRQLREARLEKNS